MANPFTNPFGRRGELEALQREIARLERSVTELSVLSELAFAMGTVAEPDDIVKTLVDRLMRAVSAEQVVVTQTQADEESDPMMTNLRLKATSASGKSFHFSDSLLGWMHLHKAPLIINDPGRDERFKGVQFDPSIRSLACVPMLIRNELRGVITVYNKKDGAGFSDDDQRLLSIIAAQSAQMIDKARLHKEAVALEQIRQQQRAATLIQRNLLPSSAPKIDGYDIAGASTPAQDVGGDLYDFIPAPGGKWAICLGDVSGKGVPAALLMANTQATLRAQTLAGGDVKERVGRANTHISESTGHESFVTLFYSVLDPALHTLTFSNAGHDPALLYTADARPTKIASLGPALGVIAPFDYGEATIVLDSGDVLVVYSDGVTDATNAMGEMFGIERLQVVIARHKSLPATELVSGVLAAVDEFVGEAPQFDDLTLVVVKRT